MKIRELIAHLQGENPEHIVVMASDAEGNNFSPLCDVSVNRYEAETTWHGELTDGKINAFVLWPTN